MSEPYTKVLKRIVEWDYFSDAHVLQLLIYLISTVNFKAEKWRGIHIKVGQKITSIEKLADACGCSKNTIQRCLKVLQDAGTIELQSDNKKTIITLVNYAKHQRNSENSVSKNDMQVDTQPDTQVDMQPDTQPDHNIRSKEYKNVKKEKNNSVCRFTPPTLEQVVEYCKERKNNVDAQRWFNYYTANGWKVGKNSMKDWRAAVRTWENANRSSQPAPAPKSMQNAYVNDRWKR